MPGPRSLPGDGWVCLVPGPIQEVAMPGLGSLPGSYVQGVGGGYVQGWVNITWGRYTRRRVEGGYMRDRYIRGVGEGGRYTRGIGDRPGVPQGVGQVYQRVGVGWIWMPTPLGRYTPLLTSCNRTASKQQWLTQI